MRTIAVLATGWVPFVIAQMVQPSPDITGLLTGSAVTILGTIVIAFVRRWIVPGTSYDKLEFKYDAVIEELRQRSKDDREVFIPAMTRYTDMFASMAERQGKP